jgi:hypothetical protein
MERVLAREHVELPRQQGISARRAPFPSINRDETGLQYRDVTLDCLRILRCIVHLRLELIDMRGIALQRVAYFFLEIVYDDKIREER